jgi:VanZ family protein
LFHVPAIRLVLSRAYGGIVELIQLGEPERSADVLGWLTDGVGAGLAVTAIMLLSRFALRRLVICRPERARQ